MTSEKQQETSGNHAGNMAGMDGRGKLILSLAAGYIHQYRQKTKRGCCDGTVCTAYTAEFDIYLSKIVLFG